jgi:hypothetical protein
LKRFFVLLLLIVLSGLLASCTTGADSGGAVKAVEQYINAIVKKDADRLSSLSCAKWESQALTELDSFQAVTTSLEGLSCQATGADADTTLVVCKGKIVASYNGENQELDLSTRTYEVIQDKGDWLVCGVR